MGWLARYLKDVFRIDINDQIRNCLVINSLGVATSPAQGTILARFYFPLWGGIIRISGPSRPPPSPAKTNIRNQIIQKQNWKFLSASRHVFLDPIEPASKRTQESTHVHVGRGWGCFAILLHLEAKSCVQVQHTCIHRESLWNWGSTLKVPLGVNLQDQPQRCIKGRP